MADCTKTVDFIRELVRMCDSNDACSSCHLHDAKHGTCRRTPAESLSEDTIAIVQKWSDEHPVMTWEGKLKELLPNVDMSKIVATCCPYNLLGGEAPNMETCRSSGDYEDCVNCWHGEYKEEP